jgi:hypothetical protein
VAVREDARKRESEFYEREQGFGKLLKNSTTEEATRTKNGSLPDKNGSLPGCFEQLKQVFFVIFCV